MKYNQHKPILHQRFLDKILENFLSRIRFEESRRKHISNCDIGV